MSVEQQYGNSGQNGSLKSWYIPTRLFGVTSLKTVTFGTILLSTTVLEFFFCWDDWCVWCDDVIMWKLLN